MKFSRAVIHLPEGEAWGVLYGAPDGVEPIVVDELLTWKSGRVEADTATFARAFNDELQRNGFSAQQGESLFATQDGSADYQIAVLIDSMQGRFCLHCPGWLVDKNVAPATVNMTAHWEIYSNLDRKVVARVDTTGAADSQSKLKGASVMPGVLAAFGENVRRLMSSAEFRTLVTSPGPEGSPASPLGPIMFHMPPGGRRPLASASQAVAAVLTGDGFGTGFLISSDGYLLTNQHVVGEAKFVKVRWSDKKEVVGEVVRSDRRRDIALIKVDPGGRLPLTLRPTLPSVGDSVFAIGTPLDEQLQSTVTKGIVSAHRTQDGQAFIQSDVAINHGNSGGPLIDENGAVLGVADLFIGPDDKPVGLNFFIPIADALKVLSLTPG